MGVLAVPRRAARSSRRAVHGISYRRQPSFGRPTSQACTFAQLESPEYAEWCRRLEAQDVPHAPMYTTAEVPDDPQAKHLQLFVETTHPEAGRFRSVRSPVSFDGERALEITAPPLLGEHNADLGKGGWPERSDRLS